MHAPVEVHVRANLRLPFPTALEDILGRSLGLGGCVEVKHDTSTAVVKVCRHVIQRTGGRLYRGDKLCHNAARASFAMDVVRVKTNHQMAVAQPWLFTVLTAERAAEDPVTPFRCLQV